MGIILLNHFLDSNKGEVLSGHPTKGCTDKNVQKVHKIINKEWRSSISGTSRRLGLSYGTCQQIQRQDLNMWQFSKKSVSQLLTDKQKQHNFWPLKTWLRPSKLLIYLVIYSCFQEWNQSYKVTDSSCRRNSGTITVLHVITKCQFQQYCYHWQKHWTHCINLKKMTNKKGNNIFLYLLRPWTFGYALMCQIFSSKTLINHITTQKL
jgi:hypothetical protein